MSSRDRDFRPSRRRGFDDDNLETPRHSFGAASGSNAQKFEAPSGPPIQAVVKWYNPDKGFGFITPQSGGKDVFIHATVLERAGLGPLQEGQSVRMGVVQGAKGPEAGTISLA